MELLDPRVMLGQLDGLTGDLRELTPPFDEQVRAVLSPPEWASIEDVHVTGSGDSYHAARAAELAFATIAGVACWPMSSQRFLDYGAPFLRTAPPGRALVVAVSASGGTERIVQGLERANQRGALTVALTGTPGSAVTRAASRTIVVEPGRRERSPGIRTYQASLVGLLLLAIRLGERRGRHDPAASDRLRGEVAALADAVDATNRAIGGRCDDVAAAIAGVPAMMMLGSGPSCGTALFAAAKVVEAAGVLAVGQDLEEWQHVERFARPLDMPVFVIAPAGRSHGRAADLVAEARALGRRVFAVVHADDTEVARHAEVVLPVLGQVRLEFSPLLYGLFACHLGCRLAQRLGRTPFQARA